MSCFKEIDQFNAQNNPDSSSISRKEENLMKTLLLHNNHKDIDVEVLVDDRAYEYLAPHIKKMTFNNYGYPGCEWLCREKMMWKPLHTIIFFETYGRWSQQYIDGVHHRTPKTDTFVDNRVENLQLRAWDEHGIEHAIEKGYYAIPRPQEMRIA